MGGQNLRDCEITVEEPKGPSVITYATDGRPLSFYAQGTSKRHVRTAGWADWPMCVLIHPAAVWEDSIFNTRERGKAIQRSG